MFREVFGMSYSFFSTLSRLKYINRWGLMNNTRNENLSEHSLEVAFIAHALCIIKNKRFGGSIDADKVAVYGMFQDCTEIITGDLPTPIKYSSKKLREAYKAVEEEAGERLLSTLPDDLREEYEKYFVVQDGDEEIWKIVKSADRLSALIKCIDERRMGNMEFCKADESTRKIIEERYPEYLGEFDKLHKRTSAHMFNMFIMKKEILNEYCTWLFDILFELEKRTDASKYDSFHARFYGRISELLLDVWINKNQIKYEEVKVMNMQKINWWKKGTSFLRAKFTGKKYEKSF